MRYKNYNDYELIYMVRENDDDSKDILTEKYIPIVKNIANEFYLKYKDFGYDFEDFYLEAQIAFHRAISKYDENKNNLFYSFAILCIRRSLISFCRNISNTNKNISMLYKVDLCDCDAPDIRSDIDILFDSIQLEDELKKIIFDLPFEYSVLLELKYNGFNYREISAILDLPVSSIEFKFRKVKKIIKNKLRQL